MAVEGVTRDAGLASIAAHFQATGAAMADPAPAEPAAPGPGTGEGAGLAAGLGGQLAVTLGHLSDELRAARTERQRRYASWDRIHPVELAPVAANTASGAMANPEKYGPREGCYWDVKVLIAVSFTAGVVTAYKGGGQTDASEEAQWLQPGVWSWSKGALLVHPGEWLSFAFTSITGAVTIHGRALEIRSDYLPAYLV